MCNIPAGDLVAHIGGLVAQKEEYLKHLKEHCIARIQTNINRSQDSSFSHEGGNYFLGFVSKIPTNPIFSHIAEPHFE